MTATFLVILVYILVVSCYSVEYVSQPLMKLPCWRVLDRPVFYLTETCVYFKGFRLYTFYFIDLLDMPCASRFLMVISEIHVLSRTCGAYLVAFNIVIPFHETITEMDSSQDLRAESVLTYSGP